MAASYTPQELHDRATRGVPLSTAEKLRLDEWYAQQNREECELLLQTPVSRDVEELRSQVEDAVLRLAALTRRVQSQSSENETVRKEILALQQQLSERSTKQTV